jgi:transcriptional regulator with XRE-family HTH domain
MRNCKPYYKEGTKMLQNMREIRKAKGISQIKLAAVTGIDWHAISAYENCRRPNPTLKTLLKFADALEVSIDDLVGRDDAA